MDKAGILNAICNFCFVLLVLEAFFIFKCFSKTGMCAFKAGMLDELIPDSQPSTKLLRHLAGISNFAILMTMHFNFHPAATRWPPRLCHYRNNS